MSGIRLKGLTRRFGDAVAVAGIDLDIADGEFVVLVGPSGCGKTTTLRMIAGLETATAGDILIGDRRVNDVPAKDRDIAMVFQSYALYPHMSVFDNMAFGLRLRRFARDVIGARIGDAAGALGLGDLLDRKPRALSGGQRQRVAMGRAIVRDPRVFLFDEPLSNLDAKLRVHMRTEIKRLHQRLGNTIVYVTHDQVEAMTLADRIVVMNAGAIEQVGPPEEMYEWPRTRFVAGFIGSPAMNFVDGRVEGEGDALRVAVAPDVVWPVPSRHRERYARFAGRPVVLGIRPEHMAPPGDEAADALVTATVDVVEPLGMDTMVYFRLGSAEEMCARVPPRTVRRSGETLRLAIDFDRVHLIDPATDRVV